MRHCQLVILIPRQTLIIHYGGIINNAISNDGGIVVSSRAPHIEPFVY